MQQVGLKNPAGPLTFLLAALVVAPGIYPFAQEPPAEAHGVLGAMEAELDRLRPWLRAELWPGSGPDAVEAS